LWKAALLTTSEFWLTGLCRHKQVINSIRNGRSPTSQSGYELHHKYCHPIVNLALSIFQRQEQRAVEVFYRKRHYPSVIDRFAGAAKVEVEVDAVLISKSVHESQMRGKYSLTNWAWLYAFYSAIQITYLLFMDNLYLLLVITATGISRQKAWGASFGAENCPTYA
jgi:hypothetical protein